MKRVCVGVWRQKSGCQRRGAGADEMSEQASELIKSSLLANSLAQLLHCLIVFTMFDREKRNNFVWYFPLLFEKRGQCCTTRLVAQKKTLIYIMTYKERGNFLPRTSAGCLIGLEFCNFFQCFAQFLYKPLIIVIMWVKYLNK